MTYPNEAMEAVCHLLNEDWGLTEQQVRHLSQDLPRDFAALVENQAEADWHERQQALMESGGPDDSAYRRAIAEAGRGHLLGGA